MCGICGKFNFQTEGAIQEELIRDMCAQIVHRGPDDQGLYVKGPVGIGMRRLSIIDVQGGHQPIHNEDESVWMVCNGEIYNFHELRHELEQRGHYFFTNSDVEVLVHSYEEYGLDFLNKVRGMFALALWDHNQHRFILARDRVGKKPLFYGVKNGSIIFGSEVKSILQDPSIQPKVNLTALDLYLTSQSVPAPFSIFEGIQKLPPAHMLICERGVVREERYWDIPKVSGETKSEQDYLEQIRIELQESVRLRMISDVPLGAFLSGGVDSSVIVALMAQASGARIKTFSIGFEEQEFSETQYARVVADRFGTDHQELVVTPNVMDLMPKLVWHYNEPFADSSAIPTFYLSEMTKQSVTVALSGDGGDELFAGYAKFAALEKIAGQSKSLSWLKQMVNQGVSTFGELMPWQTSLPYKVLRSLRVRTMNFDQRNEYWGVTFNRSLRNFVYAEEVRDLIHHENGKQSEDSHHSWCDSSEDQIKALLVKDFSGYLPDDLLVKVDIASMAHSLEVRCPFLDHKLIEQVFCIPTHMKVRNGMTKYALKKSFEGILPNEILYREKAGFAIPLDSWLRHDLREWSYDVILDSSMKDFFDLHALEKLLQAHQTSNQGSKIWTLLMFSLWHHTFMENAVACQVC